MQLFHINHTIKDGDLIITDKDTIEQCRKVMRLKEGDLINVQSTLANTTTRHLIKITNITTSITGSIIETTSQTRSQPITGMIIAMANKQDKNELIAQKLTEIGIQQIIFRPSERSVIKERNTNKAARLEKIIKEAVEQSRGRFLPELSFREHPEDLLGNTKLIIFDKLENSISLSKVNEAIAHLNNWDKEIPQKIEKIYGLIGPEWGISPKDHARFTSYKPELLSLGDTVLRMETAAIIGARFIKNR